MDDQEAGQSARQAAAPWLDQGRLASSSELQALVERAVTDLTVILDADGATPAQRVQICDGMLRVFGKLREQAAAQLPPPPAPPRWWLVIDRSGPEDKVVDAITDAERKSSFSFGRDQALHSCSKKEYEHHRQQPEDPQKED